MQFKKVIGQTAVKQQLIQQVHQDRIPHAQLFLSNRGGGGLPMALAFVSYLLCEQRHSEDSCGICSSCKKLEKYIHPDIHFTYPIINKDGKKNSSSLTFIKEWRALLSETDGYFDAYQWLQKLGGERKQGNINLDQCREISKSLTLKAFEAPYKILILWMPEYLGKEGNTLLKLIEEPPENTLFILIAKDEEKILNTILSRTQKVVFPPLQDDFITHALVENLALSQEKANRVAFLADGDYIRAKQLSQDISDEESLSFINWLQLLLQTDVNNQFDWVEKFNTYNKESQKEFIEQGLHFFRETLLLQVDASYKPRIEKSQQAFAQELSERITIAHTERLSEILEKSYYYIERNINSKILMTNLTIQVKKMLLAKRKVS